MILSVVWKVVGFGMILLLAAIQSIGDDVNEAALIDGAGYWQRVRPYHPAAGCAHAAADDAGQRDRLDARLRPVLHHDRRRPAGRDVHVGLLDLPELVHLLQTGLWRDAVGDPDGDHLRRLGAADFLHAALGAAMSAGRTQSAAARSAADVAARRAASRQCAPRPLPGRRALHLRDRADAVADRRLAARPRSRRRRRPPPRRRTYLPSTLSVANYAKVFHYQAGLQTYLFNSLAVAVLTIVLCLALAVSAGYGLARFRLPAKEFVSSCCSRA